MSCLPDNLSANAFFSDYFGKQHLCVKQGLPDAAHLLTPEDVLDLALDPEGAARLLIEDKPSGNWSVLGTPLDESCLEQLPRHFSLLVQNLERYSVEVGSLWDQAFGFIPTWLRDDIMISYAHAGGSVGPHYDLYDVFLVQVSGSRRWQLGKTANQDTKLVPNQPLKLVADMGEVHFDQVLEAGDVLYVPPGMTHHGVSEDNNCLTLSFGLRSVTLASFMDHLLPHLESSPSWNTPFMPKLGTGAAALPSQFLAALTQAVAQVQPAEATSALGELVSLRRFEHEPSELTVSELLSMLEEGALLTKDPAVKLVELSGEFYAAGEKLEGLGKREQAALERLIQGSALDWEEVSQIDKQALESWLEIGLLTVLED